MRINTVDVATPKSVAGPADVPTAFQFYQLLNTPIPATIIRFHMMTQRSLSAAVPASKTQPRLKWHWHSCLPKGTKGLCAVAGPCGPRLPSPSTSPPSQFLIANLELEFHLSHRKLSPLRIPNRKFLTISRIASHDLQIFASQPITNHSSLITAFLIYGSAIKTPPNPLKT